MYHFFSHKYEAVLSWYFLSQLFRSSQRILYIYCSISIIRTTLHFLSFGHQVRKDTCQCLSTMKVQLHSSIILPKICQFFIKLSTSHHKDMSPISKVVCFFVNFWCSRIRVCTSSPSINMDCFQEWIDYRDRIPQGKFRPQKYQGKTHGKCRSGQLSRINKPVYVCIGQPTGWVLLHCQSNVNNNKWSRLINGTFA